MYVLVLTTLPVGDDTDAFARTLVGERLAACVNVLSEMQSIYRWQGSVEQTREHQVLIKTTEQRVNALWERIRELHSYDVPEFLVIPMQDGSDAYLSWIRDSTAE